MWLEVEGGGRLRGLWFGPWIMGVEIGEGGYSLTHFLYLFHFSFTFSNAIGFG